MGTPSIRRIRKNTFANGPILRANDGALLAEMQGNLEKHVNIKDCNSLYDIGGTFSFLGTNMAQNQGLLNKAGGTKNPIDPQSGIVWAYKSPRPCTLVRYAMKNTKDIIQTDNTWTKFGAAVQLWVCSGLEFKPESFKFSGPKNGTLLKELNLFENSNAGSISSDVELTQEVAQGDIIFVRSYYAIDNPNDVFDDQVYKNDFLFKKNLLYAPMRLQLTLKEEHI